jgi:hypothetical protein
VEEVWRDIPGCEGQYLVSNVGRIKSMKWSGKYGSHPDGMIRKQRTDEFGYKYVMLRIAGKNKRISVHRAVAMAFIPNPDNLPQVNHKDETRDNNCVENLEWCTILYNNNYGHRKEKTSASSTGEKNGRAILTEHDVIEIRKTYVPGSKEFCKRKLAEKYGVSFVTIAKIVTGQLWKHLLKE